MTMKGMLIVSFVVVGLCSVDGAAAHPTREFDACVTNTRAGQRCRNTTSVSSGDVVYVEAHHLSPRHAGEIARIWRLEPRSTWMKVARERVRDEGRLRWRWETTDDEIHNWTSWRLRYVLPGHGHSDTVKVRVSTPDI